MFSTHLHILSLYILTRCWRNHISSTIYYLKTKWLTRRYVELATINVVIIYNPFTQTFLFPLSFRHTKCDGDDSNIVVIFKCYCEPINHNYWYCNRNANKLIIFYMQHYNFPHWNLHIIIIISTTTNRKLIINII